MLLNELFTLSVLIMLLITGLALLVGGPPAVGRVWRAIDRFLYRHLSHFIRSAWRQYWRQILSFVAGVLATLFFLGRLP